jgi:hypothetical protein
MEFLIVVGLLVIIAVMIARRGRRRPAFGRKCPHCGNWIPAVGNSVCGFCGRAVPLQKWIWQR